MIVSGRITRIKTEDSKKTFIEVRINTVLAICFDGPYLIKDKETLKNLQSLQENYDFLNNTYKYYITGYIKRHDV
jgi:hypothetical protein